VGGFRKEKEYERYAWILLFALGIAILFFALMSLGTYSIWASLVKSLDVFPDPVEFGAAVAGWGISIIAVARTSFRKGERWAWYASWYLPLAFLLLLIHDLNVGGSKAGFVTLPLLFLITSLLGLLLPYRKFFPKKQSS
jgi:uncharacterized membrane protein